MNVYTHYKFEKSEVETDENTRIWKQNDHSGKLSSSFWSLNRSSTEDVSKDTVNLNTSVKKLEHSRKQPIKRDRILFFKKDKQSQKLALC